MTDLFTPATNESQIDDSKDYLTELVGEGRKFKDPQALAKGKVAADQHITNLEKELQGLRGELTTRLSLEEFYKKIEETKSSVTDSTPNVQNSNENHSTQVPLNADEIANLVKKVYEQEQTKVKALSNVEQVKQELTKLWGQEFPSKLMEKGTELGLSKEQLAVLAEKAPKALLKLVTGSDNFSTSTPNSSLPPSSSNSSQLSSVNSGEKNYKYYQELRKKNASEYWSPRVQNEIHNQALKMGDAFFK